MKDTMYAERRIPVVKVISGTYDSIDFDRRDTFKDDLRTLSMECYDREMKEKQKKSALPSVGAVITSEDGDTAMRPQSQSRLSSVVRKSDDKEEPKINKTAPKARKFPTRVIREIIVKAMKIAPRVVDPESEEWKLVSNDPLVIHETVISLNPEIFIL